MRTNTVKEFVIALDQEIDAIKKGKGGNLVKVFNGKFLREVSGLSVYVFNLENFLAALEDSPAEVQIGANRYVAHVLSTQGLQVEIGIEGFCGKYIAEAKLLTNLWYLLELLKKKFLEQRSAKNDSFAFSEAVFNCQPGTLIDLDNIASCWNCGAKNRIGSRASTQIPICANCKKKICRYSSAMPPNDSQKRAIDASFLSRPAIIWGPPGTGKTKTIAQAIEAHLNAGRRVLLVSHANAAVDEALEDVAEQLRATPFYNEGKLVRLGIPQSSHLDKLTNNYPLVLLDKISAILGKPLLEEKDALETERTRLEHTLTQSETALDKIRGARTLLTEVDTLRGELSSMSDTLSATGNELRRLEALQLRNKNKLAEAQSSGPLKRFFRGLDPRKIQREIDQTSILVDSKKRTAKEVTERIYSLRSALPSKEKEAETARAEASKLLLNLGAPISEVESQKGQLRSRVDAILARIAEINQHLDEIQKDILSEARLIATTLTKTFTAKQFPDTPFDVIVLDEASMAPLPHLYWAASRCCGYITIVGDFLQLPPICISDQSMAQKWLGRSIFSVLGIKGIEDAEKDRRVSLLDTQYRMVPQISLIPNRFFYQNRLKDDSSTINRKHTDDGISKSPLVLLETAPTNPWCSRLSTGGRFNLYHALLCCTLAKKITQSITEGKVGIITPYAAQARLINKIAKDQEILDRLHIGTVHRFQGGEESIIIFDTVEGSGVRVAPMLDDRKDHDASRLLNVALTRAQNRFYLVGHTKHLLSGLHADSALSRIIRHFCADAEMIASESLVDSYFTSDFEKWAAAFGPTDTSRGPDHGRFYTERNFWAKFFEDLKAAKERLIILSPFLSVRRSASFMDYFRVLKGRGVDIRVYTRPKTQQTGEMASQAEIVIDQLRTIGASVIERQSMHQKVAIMDSAIAWEGSLNILSHKDTAEHMRRFEGNSTIEEIMRNLELDEEMPSGGQTGERCPKPRCGGVLVVRSKYGRKFLGCSNYATTRCSYTRPL